MDPVALIEAQAAAGYAAEDVTMIIESMAQNGGEPTWSMGDDTPMPVLSVARTCCTITSSSVSRG